MTTEHDPRTRIVLSWLHEDAHEDAQRYLLRALDEVDTTPQRRPWWPARRFPTMNTFAKLAIAAAAVLVVAVAGLQLVPRTSTPGAQATATQPPPRPPLLARGEFVTARGRVSLAAIAEGSSVTGRMFVSEEGGDASYDVDLQCTRTTEDGLIMIGGVTTETNGLGSVLSPVGTWAAIVLKRGSPVEADLWAQRGGPTSRAASCLAFLDEELMLQRSTGGDLEPIEGFVELGESGSGGANAMPLPGAALVARGNFAMTGDGRAFELEATGEGSSVTGRLTGSDGSAVDLQCTRTTEDGLIMIGGYITDGAGGGQEGTLAAIVLKRGSPVRATIWSQRGGPTSMSASCLTFLDDQLEEQTMDGDLELIAPIEGSVEFGP